MTKLTDESIMTFGKHKGTKLANVPPDYLLWLYNEGKLFENLKVYIEENKHVLEMEVVRQKQQRRLNAR